MGTSPSGKKYIGQHKTEHFATRKRTHDYRYISFIKKKCILELNKKFHPKKTWPKNPPGYCTSLYCAFQKYTIKGFKWQILQKGIPLEELNDIEDRLILKHNALAPNGYNLKLNKSHNGSSYSEETIQRMSKSHTKSRREHLHKYRKKHEELKGIPQFVTYFESGGIRGYRILRHPNCPFKEFTHATTPVAELKKKTLDFLKKCEKKPYKTTQQRKKEKGIPKGISEQKPGRFLVQFRRKGIKYNKFFSQEPRAVALKLATEWMQNKKKELIQGEGSETK